MKPARIVTSFLPTVALLALFGAFGAAEAEERIAFRSDAAGPNDIYTMASDGTDIRNITEDAANDGEPSWSPDGAKIAYFSDLDTSVADYMDVFVILANGTGRINLTQSPTSHDSAPDWKPDGTKIVFNSNRDGDDEIYVMDADGLNPSRLTVSSGTDYAPAWSPDGAHIAFTSIRDGNLEVYVMNADGSGVPWNITNDPADDSQPAWSPDGTKIAFMTTRDGASEIYVMDADGTNPTPVTTDGGYDLAPFWSPDGAWVGFQSQRTGSYRLYVLPYPLGVDPTDLVDLVAGGHGNWGAIGTVLEPTIDVTPAALAVPDTPVGIPGSGAITIASTGAATLTVSDITSDNAAFTVSSTPAPPFDLLAEDPDLSQTVTVTFTPTVEGLQTANITISHNAAGSPTTVPVTGTAIPAADATITVADAQGQVAGTTSVPIDISDVTASAVAAVEIVLTYDEALLTPQNDGTNTTAATPTGLVPAGWTLEQNVPEPGELRVALAGESADPIVGGGTLVELAFDVSATATVGATSPLTLTTASLNEGGVTSASVAGTFTVVALMYGDVTGNGTVSPYDATYVLDYVVAPAGTGRFPIQDAPPVWGTEPVSEEDALEVADVDDSGAPQAQSADIMAIDASVILQYVVGLVTDLPAVASAAPVAQARAVPYELHAASTSSRPGARITITLDAAAMADLRAGELVLDFDGALVRPVDVSLKHGTVGDGPLRPVLAKRADDGQLAIAFASAGPIEASDAFLEVTFEATRDISHARESAIRASHLRLNRSLVETDFTFPFRIEPFQTRLMANYPNPFNPETWIPFELAEAADVTIRIYGLDGGLVRKLELGPQGVGEYVGREDAAYWDGRNAEGEAVASGVYVYELAAGDYHALRRMVVMK